MADKKISQLTTLAQADVAVTADFLPIVDTGSTETKKVTPQALVQAGATGATLPVALGAVGTPSYTFTGDLNTGVWSPAADTLAASTGGSERLRVDSSGNVGIGTVSPSVRLDVSGQANATTLYATSNTASSFVTRLTNSDFQLYAVNGVAGNNSGDVKASIGLYFANTIANLGSGIEFPRGSAATNGWLNFLTSGVERMRLDASGNLGIGMTPSAWRSGATALQVGSFVSLWTQSNGSVNLTFNAYENGVNTFAYRNTGDAPTLYSQLSGVHTWSNAVAGTANATFSFTERMRLDSSGNLGIGTASPGARLDVQGPAVTEASIRLTSLIDGSVATPRASSFSFRSGSTPSETARIASFNRFGNQNGGDLVFSTSDSSNVLQTRASIDSSGNIVAGASAALATTATNGFLYVPTCAGTPTGVPTAITGMAPIVVNTTNNKLYFYSGGAWRDAGP